MEIERGEERSMTSIYLVQIASVPGHQVGQRQFEQSRRLHDLLINLLLQHQTEKKQIPALTQLLPQHEIVLRSGFSHTAQWGLEPNMFIQIRGNEKQARMISALFGQAFCQDGIGIGGEVQGESHPVYTIRRQWTDENERLKVIEAILQIYPHLSAQLDTKNQLTFHDYFHSESSIATDDLLLLVKKNLSDRSTKDGDDDVKIEVEQMRSALIDRKDYENFLALCESAIARRTLNILRKAHAQLFSGYPCASLPLPSFSLRRRQKRREDKSKQIAPYDPRPAHLCTFIFTSSKPCMCLTDYNCFCHYTFIFTKRSSQ